MAETLPERSDDGRWRLRDSISLVILSGIVGLNTVDRNMLALLLPQIERDIPMSDTTLGLLMGPAFVIVYSVAGVPIAWLADRTSRRNIIVIGLSFWSLVTAATGFAANKVHLLLARVALGVGEASNLAPSSALVGDLFKGPQRVFAMAVFTAGGPLAIMIFYPVIGWIAETHGWRAAYPVMGLVGLVVAALALLVVREPRKEADDAGGEARPGFRDALGTILRSRAFLLLIAGGTMVSINYSALLAWLPSFMQRVHGLDAQATGALLGMYKGGLGVAASLIGGLIVTWLMRFNQRWLAWAPALFCAAMAPAQLMLLLFDDPFWWQVGLALETILLAGINPCLFALLITLLPQRIRATGSALYLLVFNLVGQSLGPLVVGALNDGPLSGFGTGAVRYSLLTAPLVVAFGAVLLLLLSLAMPESGSAQEGEAV